MAFVRVSGYGQDDIDNARKEGMSLFIDNAVCTNQDYSVPLNGTQLAKNATATIFSNKQIDYDCIMVITIEGSAKSATDWPILSLDVTANSGQVQRIRANGFSYYPDDQSYMRSTTVALYKVKKNSILTATMTSLEKTIRVSAMYYIIHTPEEA